MASNQVQAMPARLDGTNTTYWAHFMTNFERKLWKYVATKIEKPTNLIQEEWESDIGKNQLLAYQLCGPYYWLSTCQICSHPKDAWNYLAQLYVQSNSTKRLTKMENQNYSTR